LIGRGKKRGGLGEKEQASKGVPLADGRAQGIFFGIPQKVKRGMIRVGGGVGPTKKRITRKAACSSRSSASARHRRQEKKNRSSFTTGKRPPPEKRPVLSDDMTRPGGEGCTPGLAGRSDWSSGGRDHWGGKFPNPLDT